MRRGYSMLEVLFGIVMVGMAASVVFATMPLGSRGRAQADLTNRATSLAQKQLEAIRGLGYPNADPTQLSTYGLIDSPTPVAANTFAWTNVDAGMNDSPATVLPGGTATVFVQRIDLDLKQVIVTVNWNDRGTPKSYSVGTLIANL